MKSPQSHPILQSLASPFDGLLSGVSYIYRWLGLGAADASFSNSDALDTVAEGAITGTATVLIPTAGTVAISSNQLVITHDASAGQDEVGVTFNVGTKTAGRAVMLRMKSSSASGIWSFGPRVLATLGRPNYTIKFDNGNISAQETTLALPQNTIDQTALFDVLFVSGGSLADESYSHDGIYGCRYFIKQATSSTWYLVDSCDTDNANTQYFIVRPYSANLAIYIDYCQVLNKQYYVAPLRNGTPDENTMAVLSSDFLIDFKFTTPGSLPAANPTLYDFNILDADNLWRVKILPAASGTTCSLHKVVEGVESAALASASVVFDAATTYYYAIRKVGTAFRQLEVQSDHGGDIKFTYTSNDTAFNSSTNAKWTFGDQTLVSQMIWKTTGWEL